MANQFINIFEIVIKNIIVSYFIFDDDILNNSIELNGLMLCCKSIEKALRNNFRSRYQYTINNTTDLESLTDGLKI